MYKIGIIGDRDSTLCFMALGFTVLEAATPDEGREQLHRAAKSGDYAVLYLTEDLAALLGEDIARYKDDPLPAITVIPGRRGSTGMGLAAIKAAAERAVGIDILK
ncbi:MAG: V-type ATP synthase subunit F [Clostridia bacterium]|nr:V-type ATP synthase subunit F [Clostridia bacterium]